jgi:putative intracellular protease/amidase
MRQVSGAQLKANLKKAHKKMPKHKLILPVILLVLFVFSMPNSAGTRKGAPMNQRPALQLVRGGAISPQSDEKKKSPTVAILLFDRVEIIDFAGPWEVFGGAGYKVFTVAEKLDPVNTVYGQKIVADYTFDNSPKADVLLVPGGGVAGAVANVKLIKWVQDNAKNSTYVMSVCTGAFILAKADLLNGLSATTVRGGIDRLATTFPNIKVVYDKRYVDNGKIITTAGLSSGIDGAFYLVSRMLGKGQAQQTALGLEYKWDPDAKFARAAYADRYLPNFQGLDGDIASIDGDTEHWVVKALVTKPGSPAEIIETIKKQVVADTPHKSSAVTVTPLAVKSPDRSELKWKFTDDLGRAWVGSGVVAPSAEEKGKFNLTLNLARAK